MDHADADADAHALLARLLRPIAPEADLGAADPDAPIQEALDLDSMDFLRLVAALRDQAGITVPERDYPYLSSIRGLVDYVARARETAPGG